MVNMSKQVSWTAQAPFMRAIKPWGNEYKEGCWEVLESYN